MKPHLSVVIPAYNEALRLKKTLPEILSYFNHQQYTREIIIVNDGSIDQTKAVVSQLTLRHQNVKFIHLSKNSGKGAAIRAGVLSSTANWVLFMDADLSTPLSQLEKFWPHTSTHPIVIGSRKIKGANIKRHQSWLRENLGKVFTILTNTIATRGISDITCGFKLFKGSTARALFAQSVLSDWSFDAEILYLAQKNHLPIKEIPVIWKNDPRTKVNMFKDGYRALLGLIKIRLNDLSGLYTP